MSRIPCIRTHLAHQPLVNSSTAVVAEVASISPGFGSAPVGEFDDPDFQISVIGAMGNFHRYFFIMPTLARFGRSSPTRRARRRPLGLR
jgi:hypothetical protein